VPSKGAENLLGKNLLREELNLPEVSQIDVIRHFTHLSSLNYGVDTGFYPLGSCTMKYNPKIDEEIAANPDFAHLHPLQDEDDAQGMLQVLFDMQQYLAEISGMDAVTLQPSAGAQGEFTALMVFKRHHEMMGEGHRNIVVVPDSSHGTNPATAARCGYQIRKINSGPDGLVDLEALSSALGPDVAAFMLTNPNTLGLFDKNIEEIARRVHDAGALFYCDGANMNAVMGINRPGDCGFDAMHFNLHKTFAAPHGGGGPGSGPVAVKDFLSPYLPVPVVKLEQGRYFLDHGDKRSIGKVHAFYGNTGVVVKSYACILAIGAEGVRRASENAVLNANYLLSKLTDA
jgi:glycine dehydrogenase subunit 2